MLSVAGTPRLLLTSLDKNKDDQAIRISFMLKLLKALLGLDPPFLVFLWIP
jgi:hypothetical protein